MRESLRQYFSKSLMWMKTDLILMTKPLKYYVGDANHWDFKLIDAIEAHAQINCLQIYALVSCTACSNCIKRKSNNFADLTERFWCFIQLHNPNLICTSIDHNLILNTASSIITSKFQLNQPNCFFFTTALVLYLSTVESLINHSNH